MKKPSHEANLVASRERAKILRYLRKRQRDEPTTLIGEIVAWINGMPKRARCAGRK
jgi:hypothetical protein